MEKKWRKGIPKYTDEDLMTLEELHQFGIQVILGVLKNDDYNVINIHPHYGIFPSIIAQKNNETYAIVVESDIAPNKSKIRLANKLSLINFCKNNNLKAYYASVSIGSEDSKRFDKSLALRGDAYLVNFTGFEEIECILPEVNTNDYKVFLYSNLVNYVKLSDKKHLKTIFSKKTIIKTSSNNKPVKNPVKYLLDFNKKYIIDDYCLIQSVDVTKKLKTKKIKTINKEYDNANLMIMQEKDKVNLFIGTSQIIFGNDVNGVVLNIDLDENGKITQIEMIDPRLYSYRIYDC